MSEIHYVTGDATDPISPGTGNPVIIAHVCNDVGGWGAGFVMALSAKDRRPEWAYRGMFKGDGSDPKLGDVQLEVFDPTGHEGEDVDDVFVANMIAQRGFKTVLNNIPLDYKALRVCLDKVGQYAVTLKGTPTIHMPRIGCGLAGGEWSRVEEIIRETLITTHNVEVYVYDLPTAS